MSSTLRIDNLRFEHHPTGLGVGVAAPRISWRFGAGAEGIPKDWVQTSYEVQVMRFVTGETQTFQVQSSNSVLNPWPDRALASRERARVRVRAVGSSTLPGGAEGEVPSTEWSNWAEVEAGLLERADWKAVCATSSTSTARRSENGRVADFRPIRLRKAFPIAAPFSHARLYITSLGVYEAYLNGTRIGEEIMSPGWTSYRHRIPYQIYDVGNLLRSDGLNTLAVEVAEGWYAGRLVWGEGVTCFYGDQIGIVAQLELFASDATSLIPSSVLTSDETWEWRESPLLSSAIYDGETYDMSQDEAGWNDITSQASKSVAWEPATSLPLPEAPLIASSHAPQKVTEVVTSKAISISPKGKSLVDFGQNLVGKVMLRAFTNSTEAAITITIRHTEVLEHGELGIRPLRAAKAIDQIIVPAGASLSSYSPCLTTHGFRYIEVTLSSPVPGFPTAESFSALVIHADLQRTGHFSCSSNDLNQLHSNIVWSMRGNFTAVPTDCPQRDERLGWTGDIAVFSPTASFLYDSAGFLASWMRDVTLDQAADGGIVPLVVPNVLPDGPWPCVPQAVWDDVVILLPWTLYTWYGDAEVLREAWDGMNAYLNVIPRREDGLWKDTLWQLGDWLDPNAPPEEPALGRTDGVLVADAYLVHVTRLMAKIAGVLGETASKVKFEAEAEKLSQAWAENYITPRGLVVADSQTAFALALVFGLHPDGATTQVATAATRLGRLVRMAKFRVSTGFAGTASILTALCRSNDPAHLQLAYAMILERSCPSWLYPVTMGATTIWERWDSMLPDGTINPGEMTSFNHYALGAVGDWMHTVIGGLAPGSASEDGSADASGWKRFKVRPRPGGDLSWAQTEFTSVYGRIRCSWRLESTSEGTTGEVQAEQKFVMDLTVPPNSTAVVVLPGSIEGHDELAVGSGEHHFECPFVAPAPWPPKAFRDKPGEIE